MGNQLAQHLCTEGARHGPTSTLLPGERRWVPEQLHAGAFLCGANFQSSWGDVEVNCVLVGQNGAFLGVVGPRGLARADGISVGYAGECEVFSLSLARMNFGVRSVYFVATPRVSLVDSTQVIPAPSATIGFPTSPTSTLGAAAKSAGMAAGFLARVAPLAGPPASGPPKMQAEPALETLCQFRFAVPARAPEIGSVVMALHAGTTLWHVEAIGKTVWLQTGTDGKVVPSILASYGAALTELALRVAGPGDRPQEEVPVRGLAVEAIDAAAKTEAQALASTAQLATADVRDDALAAANRLLGEKRAEAERERKRAELLQKSLTSTQDSFRKVCGALSSMQYGLEAWRREALIRAQTGEASQVAAMLERFPATVQLEALLGPPTSPGPRASPSGPPASLSAAPGAPTSPTSPTGQISNIGPEHPDWKPPPPGLLPSGAGEALMATMPPPKAGAPYLPAAPSVLTSTPAKAPSSPASPQTLTWGPAEDPKLKSLAPRAAAPMAARPSSATIGDAPLSQKLEDVEDWKPLRKLFLQSAVGDDQDKKGAAAPPPPPPAPPAPAGTAAASREAQAKQEEERKAKQLAELEEAQRRHDAEQQEKQKAEGPARSGQGRPSLQSGSEVQAISSMLPEVSSMESHAARLESLDSVKENEPAAAKKGWGASLFGGGSKAAATPAAPKAPATGTASAPVSSSAAAGAASASPAGTASLPARRLDVASV